jgi:hypothetical protein
MVATFVTCNRIRPAASQVGSFPRTCESVDWPRFLDPDLAHGWPILPVPWCTFRPACITHLLPRQRIRLALRWVRPAKIRVRPAIRSRGVQTPVPLSGVRTRPGGSREAARRPDGTTTMGRGRFPWRRSRGTTATDTSTMRSAGRIAGSDIPWHQRNGRAPN